MVVEPARFRSGIDELIATFPELFPQSIEQGYTLHDVLPPAKKMPEIRLRRIELRSNQEVFTIRPSFVMPYMTGYTDEVEKALEKSGLEIKTNDTILLYLAHFDRFWGKAGFLSDWPGMAEEVAVYFGERNISAFGVEAVSPGIIDVSNTEVHQICGRMGITHYEGLVNLDKLVGRGRFRFIAFPLKFRRGSGSPVRAVAVFED